VAGREEPPPESPIGRAARGEGHSSGKNALKLRSSMTRASFFSNSAILTASFQHVSCINRLWFQASLVLQQCFRYHNKVPMHKFQYLQQGSKSHVPGIEVIM
jgi:hypothetical protein